MTNSSRNTLVLASLLLLSGVFSFGLLRRSSQKLAQKQEVTKDLQTKIDAFAKLVANRDSLQAEYDRQVAMASQQSKVILNRDDSATTYDYLLRVLNWLGNDLIYDFSLSAKGAEKYNEYVISGRSDYMELVYFTRLLEHQRTLLTIEDLSIAAESAAHSDTVSFSMVFRTHHREDGVPPGGITYKPMKKGVSTYSLFRPKYTETMPDLEDELPRILDIDSSKLIAISEDRAFVRDSRGIIRILGVGDKVLWGYLHRIDHREGAAVFKLNKYGFEENQIIYLNKEN
jgi:hypothetical protein